MIIDGRKIAAEIKAEIKIEVDQLLKKGIQPALTIVQIGDNDASNTYIRSKIKQGAALNIKVDLIKKTTTITTDELVKIINHLASDKKVHGIIIQLPLPKHIDEQAVLSAVPPTKDVDGFHPLVVGHAWIQREDKYVHPGTAVGIIEMLKRSGVDIKGKHAVIIGRSNIVGKPVAGLLLKENATVTICHSKTTNLKDVCQLADILIVAIGRDRMINHEYVKPGAVVIDVGMNRTDGKLYGDVDFDDVVNVASMITPVPGGVGPLTIAMLMQNLLTLIKRYVVK